MYFSCIKTESSMLHFADNRSLNTKDNNNRNNVVSKNVSYMSVIDCQFPTGGIQLSVKSLSHGQLCRKQLIGALYSDNEWKSEKVLTCSEILT